MTMPIDSRNRSVEMPATAAGIQQGSVVHICVCICTYQRTLRLRRLLADLNLQETLGLFTYSIVVADNDQERSAEPVVDEARALYGMKIRYCVEPRQNIALARNAAVANATGDFVAFIDDDELPPKRWLLTLLETCKRFHADGTLGPVKPYFESDPPKWIVEGGFYDRPSYPTGYVIDGPKGRTGNVLLRRSIFSDGEPPFRPEFRTGEDQDFFRRMIEKGHVFIWCHEALALEAVPPVRWSRKFILKRALLRGAVSLHHPTCNAIQIAKSCIAVPLYALVSPMVLLTGQGRFMACVDKMFHHLGRVLAVLGIHLIREAYVIQ